MTRQLTPNFAENQQLMDELFHPQLSYDLMVRSFTIAQRPACFYMIDGLNKDDILEKIMDSFFSIAPDTMPPAKTGIFQANDSIWGSRLDQRRRRTDNRTSIRRSDSDHRRLRTSNRH